MLTNIVQYHLNRAGKNNFNTCAVRDVEFRDYVASGGIVVPKAGLRDTRALAGHTAVLHCPRTEDERFSIETPDRLSSRKSAFNSLRRIASAAVCATCPFAGKSPVDVSIMRTQHAKAEVERVEAYRLRQEAYDELIAGPRQQELPGMPEPPTEPQPPTPPQGLRIVRDPAD